MGELVVEEEYEEARRAKVPILAFIQNVKHDQDAKRFIDLISDYVDGVYRQTFGSIFDLESLLDKALVSIIKQFKEPKMDLSMIKEMLTK